MAFKANIMKYMYLTVSSKSIFVIASKLCLKNYILYVESLKVRTTLTFYATLLAFNKILIKYFRCRLFPVDQCFQHWNSPCFSVHSSRYSRRFTPPFTLIHSTRDLMYPYVLQLNFSSHVLPAKIMAYMTLSRTNNVVSWLFGSYSCSF